MPACPCCASETGLHALNLAAGGGPARRIEGHSGSGGDPESESLHHRIFISPGSKLAAVVGSGGFVRVNSRHRTGLREADKARTLTASAYGLDDGVIEALESVDDRWTIGVQFHPERRGELPPTSTVCSNLWWRGPATVRYAGGKYHKIDHNPPASIP